MPGKNSNFDPKKVSLFDRICCVHAYLWVAFVIILVQLIGMFRFYWGWQSRRWDIESIMLSIYWVILDVQIIKGLLVTHHSDPGYILPSQQLVSKGAAETFESCRRCDVVKEHARIHHCGRCNRCVDYMDHHCSITDNCVGRANYKYFFHFVSWAFLALSSGFAVVTRNVYGLNHETNMGLQNIAHIAYVMNPMACAQGIM